jgi:hypothetical protein
MDTTNATNQAVAMRDALASLPGFACSQVEQYPLFGDYRRFPHFVVTLPNGKVQRRSVEVDAQGRTSLVVTSL